MYSFTNIVFISYNSYKAATAQLVDESEEPFNLIVVVPFFFFFYTCVNNTTEDTAHIGAHSNSAEGYISENSCADISRKFSDAHRGNVGKMPVTQTRISSGAVTAAVSNQ